MAKGTLFRRKTVAQIIAAHDQESHHNSETTLKRSLSVRDLTAFGIAAIVGAGVFGTIGKAAESGGPAVIFLFIFTAIACAFSAFCYAEFASAIPISGSAYTYAYAAFGEIIAWIIGWGLIMEYAIGNIAVAIPWSDYFTSFLEGIGIHFPAWITMDYYTAWSGFTETEKLLQAGQTLQSLPRHAQDCYAAWKNAPVIFGIPLVADIPAVSIVIAITALVYVGISESRMAANLMVALKLGVIILVIVTGSFFIDTGHWSEFAPGGFVGVMKGVSAVFFAYIGFDAISTAAEEAQEPQRDLPRAMIYSLIICTILYVLLSLVLTGMVKYSELGVGDPLAYVFERQPNSTHSIFLQFIIRLVGISAVVAMTSVLLVYQMGQPRIWMSMARDGLLPSIFAKVHKKYRTPAFSTVVTGLVVALPCLFMNLTLVTDLASIGTLFAFVLVCGGVLRLQYSTETYAPRFRVPYINAQYILPALYLIAWITFIWLHPEGITQLLLPDSLSRFIAQLPLYIFIVVSTGVTVLAYRYGFSLIPSLGLISCLYLMSEISYTNWLGFTIWLLLGLVVYFSYSYRHSRLANTTTG
jgi:amino acid transporter